MKRMFMTMALLVGFTAGMMAQKETHKYVDLGLPSGTLWATCNVGATIPEGYGDYFAWGEIHPKSVYDWTTYQYCKGSDSTMTKYSCNSSYSYNNLIDDQTTLLPEDDAAMANWGPGWRTPTIEEYQELFEYTYRKWATRNGVKGYQLTGKNGNTLFLPAAGYIHENGIENAGELGAYWSNSLCTEHQGHAW